MIGNSKAIIQWLFDQQDADKLYEIKEKKTKRSLQKKRRPKRWR